MNWLKYRWEKRQRYYEVHVHQDLWSNWVVTRIWGGRNTRLGRFKDDPCGSYEDALDKLHRIGKRRLQRGYSSVSEKRDENLT